MRPAWHRHPLNSNIGRQRERPREQPCLRSAERCYRKRTRDRHRHADRHLPIAHNRCAICIFDFDPTILADGNRLDSLRLPGPSRRNPFPRQVRMRQIIERERHIKWIKFTDMASRPVTGTFIRSIDSAIRLHPVVIPGTFRYTILADPEYIGGYVLFSTNRTFWKS